MSEKEKEEKKEEKREEETKEVRRKKYKRGGGEAERYKMSQRKMLKYVIENNVSPTQSGNESSMAVITCSATIEESTYTKAAQVSSINTMLGFTLHTEQQLVQPPAPYQFLLPTSQ